MRVMIVVTHLLGTGHLVRALTLAQAYSGAGHSVCVVSGGMPVPVLETGKAQLVQLPPLRTSDTDFSRLLCADGTLATPDYHAARQTALLCAFDTFGPDVLLTELFPFGRRSLRAEFLALLQAALRRDPAPLIVASIRDILAPPSTPAKARKTEDLLLQYYDAVLVHSDAAVTPLEASWPVTPRMKPLIRYTGFVAKPPASPHPEAFGAGEILVSAGGGNVGRPLFDAAMAAAREDTDLRWRLLIGGRDPATIAELTPLAPANAIVEAARPEFRQMLHHAAASVSMCGYNTALDILQSSVPAVFVPFDSGGEVEQGLRATALGGLDGIETLATKELNARSLMAKIAAAQSSPQRIPQETGFDGAARTVDICVRLLEGKV